MRTLDIERTHCSFEDGDGIRYILKRVREDRLKKQYPNVRTRALFPLIETKLSMIRRLSCEIKDPAMQLAAPLPPARQSQRVMLFWNDHPLYLMKYVTGRRASFRRSADVQSILTALGTLHRTAQEFLDRHPEFADLDPPHTLRETMIDDLRAYRKMLGYIDSPPDRRMVWRLLRVGRLRLQRIIEFAGALVDSIPDEAAGLTVRHGDSHENNYILRDGSGEVSTCDCCCLIDLESVIIGPAVEDLVVPLWGLMRYSRYRREPLMEALRAYLDKNSLSEGERQFLLAHLILPRVWHRAVTRMLRQYHSWANPKSLQRFVLGLSLLSPAERLARTFTGTAP